MRVLSETTKFIQNICPQASKKAVEIIVTDLTTKLHVMFDEEVPRLITAVRKKLGDEFEDKKVARNTAKLIDEPTRYISIEQYDDTGNLIAIFRVYTGDMPYRIVILIVEKAQYDLDVGIQVAEVVMVLRNEIGRLP